ncbi:MAG: type II secretion system protein [Verrucomicrobiaceae bacterium]|nr:type II secretion system protein [Verrucomicrobiaceae bacterium]
MSGNRKSGSPKQRSGFSLFELLVVIAVLGVAAGLVLPSIRMTEEGRIVAAQRMAQEMASLAMAASAAGAEPVIEGDLNATVQRLQSGVTPTDGPFAGRVFKYGGGPADAVEAAKRYLRVENSILIFERSPRRPSVVD